MPHHPLSSDVTKYATHAPSCAVLSCCNTFCSTNFQLQAGACVACFVVKLQTGFTGHDGQMDPLTSTSPPLSPFICPLYVCMPVCLMQPGRTGPFLVAGLPCYKSISGQLLVGLPPSDVCQSTTNFFKVSGLPRYGLQSNEQLAPQGHSRGCHALLVMHVC